MLLRDGEVLARFGHALSDPTRARVLLALRQAPEFSSDLALRLGVSRQSMSNHLACLRDCGLVVAVPQGRRQRYELADMRLAHALSDLLGLILVGTPGHEPLPRTEPPTLQQQSLDQNPPTHGAADERSSTDDLQPDPTDGFSAPALRLIGRQR
nr:metalloregulator ArsR/SmtB family transcription factor [Kineococcus radiotolerans]